jgi:hypothetical protein
MSLTDFAELFQQQEKLNTHPLFGLIRTRQDLATFMSWHVFAVWDFMSLVKRLQLELTGMHSPWLPPANPLAARLINEIVLGEESDELPDSRGHASHFELYLEAMSEIGADTRHIRSFIERLRLGDDVATALDSCDIPRPVARFVGHTLRTVSEGSVSEVLGNFFFGRESVIPGMFQGLLEQWALDESDAPMFVYYLKRHIELDGDSHGPAALKLIDLLVKDDALARRKLVSAAHEALVMRDTLWHDLATELQQKAPGRRAG